MKFLGGSEGKGHLETSPGRINESSRDGFSPAASHDMARTDSLLYGVVRFEAQASASYTTSSQALLSQPRCSACDISHSSRTWYVFLTFDVFCRWERFEELLEEAQTTRDYDVTLAINQMIDFLLSENGAQIRQQLSVQLVDQVDQLGVDAVTFARKNVGQVSRGPWGGILMPYMAVVVRP